MTREEKLKQDKDRARQEAQQMSERAAALMDAEAPQQVAAVQQGIPLSPVRRMPVTGIRPNPRNTFRELPLPDFQRMVEDIRERGILVPLVVASDRVTLLAGHNRLGAALEIGLTTVPVQFVERELTAAEERAFVVKDNLYRRHLSDFERAALFAELFPEYFDGTTKAGRKAKTEAPSSAAAVAKATGVSRATVKRAKAVHQAAKQAAGGRGEARPSAGDYRGAAKAKKTPKSPAEIVKKQRQVTVSEQSAMLGKMLRTAWAKAQNGMPGTQVVDWMEKEMKRAGLL